MIDIRTITVPYDNYNNENNNYRVFSSGYNKQGKNLLGRLKSSVGTDESDSLVKNRVFSFYEIQYFSYEYTLVHGVAWLLFITSRPADKHRKRYRPDCSTMTARAKIYPKVHIRTFRYLITLLS